MGVSSAGAVIAESRERVVLCALALAAKYFPIDVDEGMAADFEHAAFLLTGQYAAWKGWREISPEERRRIALVYRAAPADLGDVRTFSVAARGILSPDASHAPEAATYFRLAGSSMAVPASVGGDLLGFVDRQIAPTAQPGSRSLALPFAGPGTWSARRYRRGDTPAGGTLTIPVSPGFTDPPGHDVLPVVTTTAPIETLTAPAAELLDIAGTLDERLPDCKRFLRSTLSKLLDAMDTTDEVPVNEALQLAQGGLEILHAPTGTGKSVLVRVMASWLVLRGIRVAVLLPDVQTCLNLSKAIKDDLKHLATLDERAEGSSCAHLLSGAGMVERALRRASLITEDPDYPGRWPEDDGDVIDELSYGCALNPLLEEGDAFSYGDEPCADLHAPNASTTAACPWIPVCNKHAPVFAAATANVIVANHAVFTQGRIKIGVNLDGRPVRGMTAAEFLLRSCQVLLVDEVDKFQSDCVDKSASEIVLASHSTRPAAPRDIDAESRSLPVEVQYTMQPAINHVRGVAESVLLNACTGKLNLGHAPMRNGTTGIAKSSKWRTARGHDRQLVRALWPDEPLTDGVPVPAELYERLDGLMPLIEPVSQHPVVEPDLARIPMLLNRVVAPRGESPVVEVKLELHEVLGRRIPGSLARAQVVNDLIVRTQLLELDAALGRLRSHTQVHRAAGLPSAQRIVSPLSPAALEATLPLGLIGREIYGYRVSGTENPTGSAELSVETISGDPHSFTAQLGGLVSLVLAGTERIVMGLSATAYFPQAVREHVHAPVRWWMTDASAESIVARKKRVEYGPGHRLMGEPITVSGLPATMKREALIELGSRLYDEHIHGEIARQMTLDEDRAHVLVVANSYEHCAHLATGIAKARSYKKGLCLAVQHEKLDSSDPIMPSPLDAKRLTREDFENFPKHGRVLVVPLQVVARGLNIVIGTQSAVRSIYLCVRPLALLSDTAEMYASVNAAGINALHDSELTDPVKILTAAREAARDQQSTLLRTPEQFSAMTKTLQDEVIAGVLVDLIQLAGRARRGGTDAVLHMVDYAFHEEAWNADMRSILRHIYSLWTREQREQMTQLYGKALDAFLSYAGVLPDEPTSH